MPTDRQCPECGAPISGDFCAACLLKSVDDEPSAPTRLDVASTASGVESADRGQDAIPSSPHPPQPPAPLLEKVGDHIGPYKLLQKIGEGGMGTVWMAEQSQPLRRMVALKLIKPGMDSGQILARFEAERQAVALMCSASGCDVE